MAGWHERWTRWRNRILSSADFQRWTTRLPLLRGVARAEASGLFNVVAGFVYSQVLVASIELDLINRLAAAPLTADQLARATDLPVAAALRLLKAAAALEIAEELPGDRYTLGPMGAAVYGNPGVLGFVQHHKLLYADLADPVALLRRGGGGGALANYWPYDDAGADGVSAYSQLMAATQPMIAEQVLAAYDFGRHRHLLDVGGGEGAFVSAVRAAHPQLDCALFDLPAVADRARSVMGEAVRVHGGSFLSDPIPTGADLITLVRILHDHDDPPAMVLLRSIFAALPRGGRLMIAEPMAGTRGSEPMGEAYFGMYLLAMGSGRPRTAREIKAMLADAGFARATEIATPMPMTARIIVATA